MGKILRRIVGNLLFWGLICGILIVCLPGWNMVQRIRYVFSPASAEEWMDKALAGGYEDTFEEYYYEHMDEKKQQIYRELFTHIWLNEDSGSLYTECTVEEFWEVYYAIQADHPELFWLDVGARVEESSLTGRVVNYYLDTTAAVEERSQIKAAIDATVNEILYESDQEAEEYEKIKAVYEYIIDSTEYDAEAENSQNIQSVLISHRSVCAGYAKAFQYILHRMGLFCTYITGSVQGGGDHGWNLIRMGENYYYVDVTWGDPVFAGEVEGDSSHSMNYNYLCCTDTELFQTHTPDDSVALPVCWDDQYNYYKRNGDYFENYDADQIYEHLMNSVWNEAESVSMKFGSYEAYQEAKNAIFEEGLINDAGQYLMSIHGVSGWNYRYHTDDNFYLITIYW